MVLPFGLVAALAPAPGKIGQLRSGDQACFPSLQPVAKPIKSGRRNSGPRFWATAPHWGKPALTNFDCVATSPEAASTCWTPRCGVKADFIGSEEGQFLAAIRSFRSSLSNSSFLVFHFFSARLLFYKFQKATTLPFIS